MDWRKIDWHGIMKIADGVDKNMVNVRFENKNAAEKVITVRCSMYSIDYICMWYAAYNSGDKYDVYIDGQKRLLDENGLIIGSVS